MAMDGAFESIGAVTKYADEVTGLTYANKLDIDSDFKGFNLDDSEIFFKNTDDIKPLEKTKSMTIGGGGKQFLAYKPNGTRYTVQELLDADILKDITVQVEKGEIIIDTNIK